MSSAQKLLHFQNCLPPSRILCGALCRIKFLIWHWTLIKKNERALYWINTWLFWNCTAYTQPPTLPTLLPLLSLQHFYFFQARTIWTYQSPLGIALWSLAIPVQVHCPPGLGFTYSHSCLHFYFPLLLLTGWKPCFTDDWEKNQWNGTTTYYTTQRDPPEVWNYDAVIPHTLCHETAANSHLP